jgi:hypothetical protein
MATESQTRTAPYVAFKSFCSAVQNLRVHGLPSTLNRTAWENRSGAEQSQILGALQFLGLVNDKNETQPSLKQLCSISEGTDEERSFYATLLRSRYDEVFELDLQSETPKQLEDAIGKLGVSGNIKDRAVRFFLKAAVYAKIPLSTRLTANLRDSPAQTPAASAEGESQATKGNGKVRRKPKQRANGIATGNPPAGSEGTSSNAMKTIDLPKVAGSLSITGTFNAFQLMGEERELVYKIIDLMNAYEEKSKSGKISE